MPIVIFADEDRPPAPDGPHFRVIVLLPEFVEGLVDRPVGFFTGGA